MKIELEEKDLRRIASMVVEQLRPILESVPAHVPIQVPAQGKADEIETMLDIPGLCKLLGVSERWVRTRVSNKTIPCHKMGGVVRFKKRDVDTFLKVSRNI